MPELPHVYLARHDAYQRIVEEAWASPARETGGILVGRMVQRPNGRALVVVAASGPGPRAERQPALFVPDTAAHQHDLDRWRERYAAYAVDYVGEWHSHPPGQYWPSQGDTDQVTEILSDRSYNLPDGMLTPIVMIDGAACTLHMYYYPRHALQPFSVVYSLLDGDPTHFLAAQLKG